MERRYVPAEGGTTTSFSFTEDVERGKKYMEDLEKTIVKDDNELNVDIDAVMGTSIAKHFFTAICKTVMRVRLNAYNELTSNASRYWQLKGTGKRTVATGDKATGLVLPQRSAPVVDRATPASDGTMPKLNEWEGIVYNTYRLVGVIRRQGADKARADGLSFFKQEITKRSTLDLYAINQWIAYVASVVGRRPEARGNITIEYAVGRGRNDLRWFGALASRDKLLASCVGNMENLLLFGSPNGYAEDYAFMQHANSAYLKDVDDAKILDNVKITLDIIYKSGGESRDRDRDYLVVEKEKRTGESPPSTKTGKKISDTLNPRSSTATQPIRGDAEKKADAQQFLADLVHEQVKNLFDKVSVPDRLKPKASRPPKEAYIKAIVAHLSTTLQVDQALTSSKTSEEADEDSQDADFKLPNGDLADVLASASLPLSLSYVTAERPMDPTGASDEDLVRPFTPLQAKYNNRARAITLGKRLPSKYESVGTAQKKDDEPERNDSDKLRKEDTVLHIGKRLLEIFDRCNEMIDSLPTQQGDTSSVLPEEGKELGKVFAPDDPGYFRLRLGHYKANSTLPIGEEGNAFPYKRRRWWWLLMFVTAVREDIRQRTGPTGPSDAAFEDIASFWESPVTFASRPIRNGVLVGPPGTGKTTFVQSLATLYHFMGLFVLGTTNPSSVVIHFPSDFVGEYEGETRQKTRNTMINILGTCGALDEAHALGSVTTGRGKANYAKEAIDEIVSMSLDFKSLFCLFLLGYGERIYKEVFTMNEGMGRRFPRRIVFTEYTAAQLYDVFEITLKREFELYGEVPPIVDKQGVVNFFKFLTGDPEAQSEKKSTAEKKKKKGKGVADEENVLTFKYDNGGSDVTLERSAVFFRRSDETEEEFIKRKERATSEGKMGNVLINLNASAMRTLVDDIAHRKAREAFRKPLVKFEITVPMVVEFIEHRLKESGYFDYQDKPVK